MKTVIGYTNYYIPPNTLLIEDYVNKLDDEFMKAVEMSRNDLASILKNSIGIKHIYIDDRKNEAKIFSGILERYFAAGGTKPEDIDFVIYTRGNSVAEGDPWSLLDDRCINVPYFLQNRFKMKNAQVFNVEQVCSGTMVAVRIAHSFIKEGSARKILLLSANFFKDMGNRLMGGLGLVSDAAGIMEISADGEGLAYVDYDGVTDGGITMVKDFRRGTTPADIVKVGCQLISGVVERNNLALKDIALLIPQNISSSGWNFYCKQLDYPKERVFLDTFNDGGHMADVDIIRNITEIRAKNLLSPRDYALVYGIGTGTSWSAMLLQESR
jgi:3-oxoacyl-[acyl-carrier-protein] synthase III